MDDGIADCLLYSLLHTLICPLLSGGISVGWTAEQKPLAKVVDFIPLGALSGLGAPGGSRFGSFLN